MDNKITRRGFAGWVGKSLLAGLFGGVLAGQSQVLRDRNWDDSNTLQRRGGSTSDYEGYSDKCDFNGALKDALHKAERDWNRGRDDTYHWRLGEVTGAVGARAGRGQIWVRIHVNR